jgi:hypothetical protein
MHSIRLSENVAEVQVDGGLELLFIATDIVDSE